VCSSYHSYGDCPQILELKKKVIDLSADYRLRNLLLYKKYYGIAHRDSINVRNAVYGLCEFNRSKIKEASLVANPGCYSTGVILSLCPLLKEADEYLKSIVIDAKSGASGAGRKFASEFLYKKSAKNFYLYKPILHQHVPEIEEYLYYFTKRKKKIVFCPHLLPIERGIFLTIYVHLRSGFTQSRVEQIYRECYRDEPFIKFSGDVFPQLEEAIGTNLCLIGARYFKERNMLVIGCVFDNLMKGASSQAVQNMNILFNIKETTGLL